MIITFDGPAGSGKSTIANSIAKKLGFYHFNSGSVFRAITAYLLEHTSNIEKLDNVQIKVKFINNIQYVFVNDVDYTPILRANHISNAVAEYSTLSQVQHKAYSIIKEFCSCHNVVIDGRGLGNEVLPNAEYKFYLDCSINERAKRRFLEEQARGTVTTIEAIEEQLTVRDELDKTRKTAPLAIPKDAIIIDTSNLTIPQVETLILSYIKNDAV